MDKIYTEATIRKSLTAGKWEEDEHGNPIVIIEASNENLDYDGERVLRSTLMDSKDYFMENGVISYDHRHLPAKSNFSWDPEWNAEKYILGKPLDAWEGINQEGKETVFVKAALSRSNKIAQEIIGKLRDNIGTVKASVGGRKVQKMMQLDSSIMKEIPTIVGVDWDEVALTHKPVNQTLGATILSPVNFVKSLTAKSLTAGSSADPSDMGTGGNTLQTQSVRKDTIRALYEKIRNREIGKTIDVINYLEGAGFSEKEARETSKLLINKNLGDVVMGKDDDTIDNASTELEKALEDFETQDELQKAKDDDGTYVVKGGYKYLKKGDSYEKVDKDAPDYKDDDDKKDMGKSIVGEEVDVTEFLEGLVKSVKTLVTENAELKTMVKSLAVSIENEAKLVKSIAAGAIEDSKLIKAISGSPQPRQTTDGKLVVDERFTKSKLDGIQNMNFETMAKSMDDANMGPEARSQAAFFHRKGGVLNVIRNMPAVADVLVKE